MIDSCSTFIVGGSFRIKEGRALVQKRSWEMLRIFSDQMASPVFGMHFDPDDRTLEYPLPDTVRIVELPLVRGRGKVVNTLLRRGLPPEIRRSVDGCYAVLLRQPLWECWDVFRYAVARKKKVLVSYHGDWPDALRKSEAAGWRSLCNRALAGYVHHVFTVIARHSEVAFCVGEILYQKYGRLAKNSVVFANFLHTKSDIAPSRPLKESPSYRLLFVGHFEEYKGVKYLILAAAILKKQGLNFKLTLVGTGSLEQDLRALARREQVDKNVEWLGYVQHGRELMEIYRQADIFVLPSIASEGTPKVLMEAMSQRVPVIATDVGSTRQLLHDGAYGITVARADSSALASAISSVLNDCTLRKSLIAKAIRFSESQTRDRQENIVKNILKEKMPEIVGTPAYRRDLPDRAEL